MNSSGLHKLIDNRLIVLNNEREEKLKYLQQAKAAGTKEEIQKISGNKIIYFSLCGAIAELEELKKQI